jgi:hypothetical protein
MMQRAIASNPSGKPDTAKDCSEKEAPSGKKACKHKTTRLYRPNVNAALHIHLGQVRS